MNKAQILQELPKLAPEECREIFERISEMEEQELLEGREPTGEEKALRDRELEDFQSQLEAGSSWPEVEARAQATRS